MPTVAEYSQSCPMPQLAEQWVNFVMSQTPVSLFFSNFWKDLSGKCVPLNEITKVINMKTSFSIAIGAVAPAFTQSAVSSCQGLQGSWLKHFK